MRRFGRHQRSLAEEQPGQLAVDGQLVELVVVGEQPGQLEGQVGEQPGQVGELAVVEEQPGQLEQVEEQVALCGLMPIERG